jgi:AraC-like DNA-binding protein
MVSGTARVEQRNRSCTLHAGEWCLFDPLQPFRASTFEVQNEYLALTIERPSDPERLELLECGALRSWDGKAGMSRILLTSLVEGFNQMNRLGSPSRSILERALTEMTWDAAREQLEAPPLGVHRDVQCARIKSYVERHVADPELSVEKIAHALGISVRSVHRAFESEPASSVSNYIWTRRLNHCAACLRDPGQVDRPITDICFSFGFNSTSHFSRLFKEQFGVPPSEYRTAFVQNSLAPGQVA